MGLLGTSSSVILAEQGCRPSSGAGAAWQPGGGRWPLPYDYCVLACWRNWKCRCDVRGVRVRPGLSCARCVEARQRQSSQKA